MAARWGGLVWLSYFFLLSFLDDSCSSTGEWKRGSNRCNTPSSLSSHYTQPTVPAHCPGFTVERARAWEMVAQFCKAPLHMGRSWSDYLCSSHRTQKGGISTLKHQSSPSTAVSANDRSSCMDWRLIAGLVSTYRSIFHTACEWEQPGQECGGPFPGLSMRPFSACSPTVLHCCISTKHDNRQVSKNATPGLPSWNFLELPNLGKRKQPLVSRSMRLHVCISIAGITEYFAFTCAYRFS